MNKKEIDQILDLNKQFYQTIADDFSQSRKWPWEGWLTVVRVLRNEFKKTSSFYDIKILDLGCGNGRFFSFIKAKIPNIKYLGYDSNSKFLKIAKNKYEVRYKTAKFIRKDVIEGIDKIKGKYDVIVAFGLTHHIPGDDLRKKWFTHLPKLLSDSDDFRPLIILTFWDFGKKPGDYLIGWSNKNKTTRFCHLYYKKEIDEIIKMYKKMGLELLNDYNADNSNRYLIFGKI